MSQIDKLHEFLLSFDLPAAGRDVFILFVCIFPSGVLGDGELNFKEIFFLTDRNLQAGMKRKIRLIRGIRGYFFLDKGGVLCYNKPTNYGKAVLFNR